MLQEKRFYSNEEVITETNAYFEAKDKSFYKKGIEMLEKHLNLNYKDCIYTYFFGCLKFISSQNWLSKIYNSGNYNHDAIGMTFHIVWNCPL